MFDSSGSQPITRYIGSQLAAMASRVAKRKRTSTVAAPVPSVSSEASTVIDFLPLLEIIPKKSIHAILDLQQNEIPLLPI